MEVSKVLEAKRFEDGTVVTIGDVVEITTSYLPSTSLLYGALDFSHKVKAKVVGFISNVAMTVDASAKYGALVESIDYGYIKYIRVLDKGEM